MGWWAGGIGYRRAPYGRADYILDVSEGLWSVPVREKGLEHATHFWSGHPAGTQFAYAGGSVAMLSYDIDRWDTNGSSCIWVRLPTLSGTNDAIQAYWGRKGVTWPICATNGSTWSAGYGGVWHLEEGGRFWEEVLGACFRLPSKDDSPPPALYANHRTLDHLVQDPKPVLPSLACRHSFHMYNVQVASLSLKSWAKGRMAWSDGRGHEPASSFLPCSLVD